MLQGYLDGLFWATDNEVFPLSWGPGRGGPWVKVVQADYAAAGHVPRDSRMGR